MRLLVTGVGGHEAITGEVGWTPRVRLAEGLAETARWYREVGWL